MDSVKQPGADARVRAAMAVAGRHRRRRAASARLWRAAPFVAGALVLIAIVSRWFRWPDAVPLIVLGISALACVAYLFWARRHRGLSDATAAAIDTEGGFGGELRSASWFAHRTTRDEWVELHLERAAERVHGVDWGRLYPRVRASRSRLTTGMLVAIALAITVVLPDRAALGPQTSAHASQNDGRAVPPSAEALPPDLQKLLEELLVAAESGAASSPAAGDKMTPADMRELLEQLRNLRDRQDLKDLASKLDRNGTNDSIQELLDLAERLNKAAEKKAPEPEFRNALEELARKLAQAAEAERVEIEFERATSASQGPGSTEATEGKIDAAAIQSAKEAQSAAGAPGMVMMSDQQSAAGAPSPGFGLGGSSSGMSAASQQAAIDSALRQEVVQANVDSTGANVESDIRRQTEQGRANTTFTHSAATKSDSSLATAPPAVPEARRSDLQRYFNRKQ